ncbi:MAG: DUF262 domain-containing HNH endonuclease family protein [bacterium]
MEAKKTRLLDFISQKAIFSIPVYQRNYDWKKEHCEKLFSDIEKLALNDSDEDIEHFLGTIVYVSEYKNGYNNFTIIDGQQRITSIYLLLLAIRDFIEDEEKKDEIYEDYLVNRRAEADKERYKLRLVENDMEDYINLINQINNNLEVIESNNIINNYNLFIKLLKNSSVNTPDILKSMSKIAFVYIQLESNKPSENPQMIFESLNSTGLSLTQSDLVRNYLLMNHFVEQQEFLYKNYWLKIENNVTNSKLSDFIRDFLTMKLSIIPNKDKVYESFKTFYQDYDNKFYSNGILEELLEFSCYYSQFLYCNSNSEEINYCLKQFKVLKTSTCYPPLLDIFDDYYKYNKLTEQDLVNSMKVLLSYIYRRLVCNYSSNALNKVFASLNIELKNSEEVLYEDKLLDVLSKKEDTSIFPKNSEFKEAFVNLKLYKNKYNKYTLILLEDYMSKEKVNINKDITIEHILPQKLNSSWIDDLGENYKEIYNNYLHTIGNLTITGYNSELSNNNFANKLEIYKNSNLAISRGIANYSKWTDKEICERAEELAEMALKIWEYPDKYNDRDNSNVINYSNQYNILDYLDVKNTKPYKLIIGGIENEISTWKELLTNICSYVHSKDETILQNLINNENLITITGKKIISNDLNDIRRTYKVSDNIFIECELEARRILKYSQEICKYSGIEEDVYYMLK